MHGSKGDSCVEQFSRVRRVKIGGTHQIDLAFFLEFLQPKRCLNTSLNSVVPPMELHEIKAIGPQPSK